MTATRIVAIDARGYCSGGGIGRYTRNLVRAVGAALTPGMELRLLISARHQPGDLDLPFLEAARTSFDAARNVTVRVSKAGWMNADEEDRWLDDEIAGVHLFHSLTGHWLPRNDAIRTIATLHDLTPLMRPRFASPEGRRASLRIATQVGRASQLIVASHSTAGDARAALAGRVPPITVIPEAAAPVFRPGVSASETLLQYDLQPDAFFLAVGVLKLHGNLERLIAAYAQSGVDAPLIVAGAPRETTLRIREAIATQGLGARVRLIGEVSDAQLAALYGACRAFVYPSLYEGFGLPVIEALACGAAVVAARSSSIPEVTGDAALLADPARTRSLVAAIKRIDTDGPLREQLRRLAIVRAAAFSWARTAAATQRVYDSVLEARAA